MNKAKYDEYGGILNPYKQKEEKHRRIKEKTHYNFVEKFLIKNAGKKYAILDESGKYNARKRKSPRVLRVGNQ